MQNKLLFALLSLLAGSLALLYLFMYTFACRYSNSLICTPFLVHIEFNRYDQYVLQQKRQPVNSEEEYGPTTGLGASYSGNENNCLPQKRKLQEITNASRSSLEDDRKAQLEAKRLMELLRSEIDRVKELKKQNDELMSRLDALSRRNKSNEFHKLEVQLTDGQFEQISKEIQRDAIYKYRDPEWATVPWSVFSSPDAAVCQLEKGISGPPVFYAEPDRKEEISDVIDAAINANALPSSYSADPQESKLYGLTRTAAHRGTIYNLYYQHNPSDPVFTHAKVIQPFAPTRYTKIELLDRRHTLLNVVLPVQFDPGVFANFMSNFTLLTHPQVCRWQLTVAYYGKAEGATKMEEILKRYTQSVSYRDTNFLRLPANYSHGEAVIAGVKSWKKSDILTVVTDVYVVFEKQFLQRCIKFVSKRFQVYFPYAFGLYNPNIVYKRKYNFVPSFNKQMVLNVHKGFWLDQDYGTWAAYKSDILALPAPTKWYNDVIIFRLMTKAGFTIIRSPERSLFVSWRWKDCNPDHEPNGYYAVCMDTNARLMGPPHTLGMIIFKIKTNRF